jgi:hypothetical protein
MEDHAANRFRRGLLRRMGLEAGAADPDEWVRVHSSPSTDPGGLFAAQRARIQAALTSAGIDVREQPYLLPDHNSRYSVGTSPAERIEIATLVHRRDARRAGQVLADHEARVDEHVRQVTADPRHDEELARLSFEADQRRGDDVSPD